MKKNRTLRLNSLLKEVISEVIFREVKNPNVSPLFTITNVEISDDLHHAKVSVSIIGTEEEKHKTLDALQQSAGFIGVHASKKVVMRYFPVLKFVIDDTVEKQMRIDNLVQKIQDERDSREK